MQKLTNQTDHIQPFNLEDISLFTNGSTETPTREEFYTNYPFYKYWNSENNEKLLKPEGINIYIHIPFCIQICDYCFYNKELIKSKEQVDEYVDYLCKEIKMISERNGLQHKRVNSIYMGGGTPSVLTERQFKKLSETLNKYHFIDADNLEFTMEAEPGTFSKSKLEAYKEHGVNRISMGVQSFDDDIIKLSSRKHSAEQAIKSIESVHEVGGFNVNIDLLSGLAGETMDTWEKSIDTALDQKINLLTLYKMKTYANTNFFIKGVHGKQFELPTAQKEIEFMDFAVDKLLSLGYDMWSTFAFTKDGAQSKYIEYTWRGQDMIAYGVSSFGKLGNVNYQNLNTTHLYYQRIKNNEMPIYRSFSLSHKDLIIKELLLCAARLFSYKKSEFVEKFGFDYFDLIPSTITELVSKGYIESNNDELILTRQGILFGDFVSKVIADGVKKVFGQDKIGYTY